MKAYADLADLPENDRITVLGECAEAGNTVGAVVEDEVKAARYERKLLKRFKVRIIDRGPGPVPGTVLIRIGPRAH